MTSRERLLAAFRLEPVDRVPIQIRGVRAWDPHWVESRDPSYRPLIEAVAEHGDYQESWGYGVGDFCSAYACPTDTWTEDRGAWVAHYRLLHTPAGDLRSMHLASKTGMPGMQTEFCVKSLEDLDRVLSVPYEPLQPDVSGSAAAQERLGDRGIVLNALPNPISLLHNLMGSELLAIWSLTERDRLLQTLWVLQRRCLDTVDYLLAHGVGPCFAMLGEEYVTPPLHSARDFRAFAVEPEREIGQRLREADRLLHIHCHGPLHAVLDDFTEIGANCLHPLEAPPMGDVPLEEAKRRLGDRVCLEGNLQIGDIYAGRTAELVAQVHHNLEVTSGQGYILCPTASPHTPVLDDLTVTNYLAVIEAAVSG